MKIKSALTSGLNQVFRNSRFTLLAYAFNFFLALVLAGSIATSLSESMGDSLAGERMVESFDDTWFETFSETSEGLDKTFRPEVTGIGSVFEGLDKMLAGELLTGNGLLVGIGLSYLLLWTFLSAVFISVYSAKDDSVSFFGRAAEFFPRFFILAALAGVLYFIIFKFIDGWLSSLLDELIRETIDERIHFTYWIIKIVFIWSLVLFVNLVFDYSKIITVQNNLQNVLTAPLQAFRLISGKFYRTTGLYLAIGTIWVVLLLIYWLIAPGAGQSHWLTILLAFLVSQLYILVRLFIRCWFYAGQTFMYRSLTSETSTA